MKDKCLGVNDTGPKEFSPRRTFLLEHINFRSHIRTFMSGRVLEQKSVVRRLDVSFFEQNGLARKCPRSVWDHSGTIPDQFWTILNKNRLKHNYYKKNYKNTSLLSPNGGLGYVINIPIKLLCPGPWAHWGPGPLGPFIWARAHWTHLESSSHHHSTTKYPDSLVKQ